MPKNAAPRAAFREYPIDVERDFGLIFDHLLRSCPGFGESKESALDRAEARFRNSPATADRILIASNLGEFHDDLPPGPRHLAIGRAIYRFDVDGDRETVRVLAVFSGGQGHVRHMLVWLLEE